MMGDKRYRDKQFTIPQFVLHANATPVLQRIPIKRELINKSKVSIQRKNSRTLEMICPISGHHQINSFNGSPGFFGAPVELNGRGVSRCNSDGKVYSAKDVVYYHYQRDENKERVDLERQNLSNVPYIEDPNDNVRILNLQKNNIERLKNLNHFNRLVCLDLYDNHLERVEGLEMLMSLRVLILGKNRIRKIENLEALSRLDMLDLHSNQIVSFENLSHLSSLRVLNLSCNFITRVSDVKGLVSLVELNLKKNRIKSVSNFENLPCLQKLYLGTNKISRLEDISSILKCDNLQELSLDYNPLYSKESNVKQLLLVTIIALKVLDSKKITDDQRRQAELWRRRDEEKRRESSKMAVFAQELNEKRYQAIFNARKKWESNSSMPSVYGIQMTCFNGNNNNNNNNNSNNNNNNNSNRSSTRNSNELISADITKKVQLHRSSVTDALINDIQRPFPVVKSNRDVQIIDRLSVLHNEDYHFTTLSNESNDTTSSFIPSPTPSVHPTTTTTTSGSRSKSCNSSRDNNSVPSGRRSDRSPSTAIANPDCFSEIDGETLKLFGSGSLDAFDHNWGLQATSSVNEITFSFIDFDEIVNILHKIKIRFPNVSSIKFCSNNISTLSQLNALSLVKRLEDLTVETDGNPVTSLKTWRTYAIFRLSHLGLSRINGEEISEAEHSSSERMFSPLISLVSGSIPKSRLHHLLGDKKKSIDEKFNQNILQSKLANDQINDEVLKSVLDYDPESTRRAFINDSLPKPSVSNTDTRLTAARECVNTQLNYCLKVDKDLKEFEKLWPQLVASSILKIIKEMLPLKQYAESSFEVFCNNISSNKNI